jgi:hypothetical protein
VQTYRPHQLPEGRRPIHTTHQTTSSDAVLAAAGLISQDPTVCLDPTPHASHHQVPHPPGNPVSSTEAARPQTAKPFIDDSTSE